VIDEGVRDPPDCSFRSSERSCRQGRNGDVIRNGLEGLYVLTWPVSPRILLSSFSGVQSKNLRTTSCRCAPRIGTPTSTWHRRGPSLRTLPSPSSTRAHRTSSTCPSPAFSSSAQVLLQVKSLPSNEQHWFRVRACSNNIMSRWCNKTLSVKTKEERGFSWDRAARCCPWMLFLPV